MERISERGSVRGLEGVPADAQRLFATAYDVAPRFHLAMQAAFQRHVHNSVSKTINCPRSTTAEEVAQIYREAYRLGLKGVTVYCDGSRDEQVLSFGTAPERRAEPRYGAPAAQPEGCPECGAKIPPQHEGMCSVCVRCGYSHCA
jgi:ribonucleoside-diphosphate reductase alpha chain